MSSLLRPRSHFCSGTFLFLVTVTAISLRQVGTLEVTENIQDQLSLLRELSLEAGIPQTNSSDFDVCYDDGCLDASFDLLNAMNGSVDPCQDFYQFSCGRWLANNPVPPTYSTYSRMNELIYKVKTVILDQLKEEINETDTAPFIQAQQYFRQCMDLAEIERKGLNPLKEAISFLGGWQLLSPESWSAESFDWTHAHVITTLQADQTPVFGIYTHPHLKYADRQAIYIDQPYPMQSQFGLPREVLVDREKFSHIFSAYETFIVDVAKELNSTQNETELRSAARDIVAFEEKLAKLSSSEEDRYDKSRLYNPYKLRDFQNEIDEIDDTFKVNWSELLQKLLAQVGMEGIGDDEEILVPEVDYIKAVIRLLSEEERKGSNVMANYIVWRFVQVSVWHSTGAMRNITFAFERDAYGIRGGVHREAFCAGTTSNAFGMVVSAKYIEREFDEGSKTEVTAMVNNLKDAFGEMVEEEDWMGNETKGMAIEKKNEMTTLMAYPDWLKDTEKLEEYYREAQLGDSYLESFLSILGFNNNKYLYRLRKPTDRELWIHTPHTVNAFHIFWLNLIMFPAGILQPPFFGGTRPKHQNYGGVGTLIGHEVTHGFDKQGAQHDKQGNLENWWDDDTKEEYERRSQCITDQYSKYCYDFEDGVTHCVNGNLTQGENIGDNAGLRHSFRAYRKYIERNGPELRLPGLETYSPEQLFFMAYANTWCESTTPGGLLMELLSNPHSPAEWRVKGVMRNSPDFAQAFNCPVDSSGMNPPQSEKCTVW